jgi:Protein of unknown function (DUF1036)
MRLRILWLIAGAVGVTCLLAMPAAADIVFCNKFAATVNVAIAYPQQDGSWLSRGWLSLDTGDRSAFDTALRVKTFYYRGESAPYREGRKTVRRSWASGEGTFAMWEKDNFNYWNAQTKVLNSSMEAFSKGGETSGDAISATVTFEADGIHTTTTIKGPGP